MSERQLLANQLKILRNQAKLLDNQRKLDYGKLPFLHMLFVMSDSSTLTAGMVGAADPRFKGATMAVHSTLGFGAGFVSPLVFGAALDLAGGNQSITAWGIAFATLGVGALVAAALLGFTRR